MNCFLVTAGVISLAIITGFINNGVEGVGNEREEQMGAITRNVEGLLNTTDNKANLRRMNLFKTVAILKGLDSAINKTQVIQPPQETESGSDDVTVDESEATNCSEAMNSLNKFYEKFSINNLEMKGFPVMNEIARLMITNDEHIKDLMNDFATSFPITELIQNADEIPNAGEKFRQLIKRKMTEEKRLANYIGPSMEEDWSEDIEFVVPDGLSSIKSSRAVSPDTDANELRSSTTITSSNSPPSDLIRDDLVDDKSIRSSTTTPNNSPTTDFIKEELAVDKSIQRDNKSSSGRKEFLEASELWKHQSTKDFLEQETLREMYGSEWLDNLKPDDPKLLEAKEHVSRKIRRQATAELHQWMWEEALCAFGYYLPGVENFFKQSLNRNEAIISAIRDMIPASVDEIVPYWSHIATQARILSFASNEEGSSIMRTMRDYVIEAETERRDWSNYEKVRPAKTTILFHAKRFSDFTLIF